MSESKFESGGISFFSGRKRYARCIETYVDKYNAVRPYDGAKCRLTSDKFYEIVDQGTFYNPSNAFNVYFPMIFIKDDNLLVWGLAEEMFNMDDEYSSEYTIREKSQPKIPELKEEEEEPKEEAEEIDTDWDADEEVLEEEEVVGEIEPAIKIPSLPLKSKEIKPDDVKIHKLELKKDWVSFIKEGYLRNEFNYKINYLPLAVMQEQKLKGLLAFGASLILGQMNSYFVIRDTPKGLVAKNLASGIESSYREISLYAENMVSSHPTIPEKELVSVRIFITSPVCMEQIFTKEYEPQVDDFEIFSGLIPSPETIKAERIK